MRRYYSLLDCIMWTTDLYRYIQESTDAMIWRLRDEREL